MCVCVAKRLWMCECRTIILRLGLVGVCLAIILYIFMHRWGVVAAQIKPYQRALSNEVGWHCGRHWQQQPQLSTGWQRILLPMCARKLHSADTYWVNTHTDAQSCLVKTLVYSLSLCTKNIFIHSFIHKTTTLQSATSTATSSPRRRKSVQASACYTTSGSHCLFVARCACGCRRTNISTFAPIADIVQNACSWSIVKLWNTGRKWTKCTVDFRPFVFFWVRACFCSR